MEHPPEILILVISRFGRTQDTTKNTSKIEITASLNIAAQSYGLIGSVHHHGSTIASGHYTSNIYFPKTAFTCNDSSIEFMRPSSFSESSYLVFYARGGCHYGTQRMGARSHDAGTSDDATSRVEEQASKPAQLVLPPDDLTTWVDSNFHVHTYFHTFAYYTLPPTFCLPLDWVRTRFGCRLPGPPLAHIYFHS